MANPVLMARAAALLTDEKTRKGLGWVAAAVLSPLILVVAALCVLGSGAASHNISAVQMCFEDGPLPDNLPEEYRVCVKQTQSHFAEIDTAATALQSNLEDGNSLDAMRVKAVFYTLYFGGEAPNDGEGGPNGGGRNCGIAVRLHRTVHWATSALRGEGQRAKNKPERLFTMKEVVMNQKIDLPRAVEELTVPVEEPCQQSEPEPKGFSFQTM